METINRVDWARILTQFGRIIHFFKIRRGNWNICRGPMPLKRSYSVVQKRQDTSTRNWNLELRKQKLSLGLPLPSITTLERRAVAVGLPTSGF